MSGTITGTYKNLDGTAAEGDVLLIPSAEVIKDSTGKVILAGRIKVALDATGAFSQAVPASDDPTLDPQGVTYTVAARLRTMHPAAVRGVTVPEGGTVDVFDVVSMDPASPSYKQLATVATTGAYADLTDKPTIPTTAAEVGAEPAGLSAATEAELATAFVPIPAGIADGEVAVWDAGTSTWVAGSPGNPGLEGRVTTLEESTPTLEESSQSVALDPGTISANATRSVFIAPYSCVVDQVALSVGAAVAASNTDYWTVTLKRYRGGVAANIGAKTTETTNGEAMAAYTEWHYDLVPFSNNEFIKGDVLVAEFTITGTPVGDIVAPTLTFRAPPADVVPDIPITPIVTDTFNRADSTTTLGNADTGQAWTAVVGTWGISSNQAYLSVSGAALNYATIDVAEADVVIQAKLTGSNLARAGLVFRYGTDGATTNRFYTTATELRKRVGASGTLLVGTFSTALSSGDTIRVVTAADNIKVYRQTGSSGPFEKILDVTDSMNQNVTAHGMVHSSATGDTRLDDLIIGTTP